MKLSSTYNKQKDDIYLFYEADPIIYCQLPPTYTEDMSLGIRRQIPAYAYNINGIWNQNVDGSGIPDWSGLHVRDRGSNLYSYPFNNFCSICDIDPLTDITPYPFVTNYLYWNNGNPPFYLISGKHFLACGHFIGFNNTSNKHVKLISKNNDVYWIEVEHVSENPNQWGGDAKLYRIVTIRKNGELVVDTDEVAIKDLTTPGYDMTHPQTGVKIYDILNMDINANDWYGTRIWAQGNQGFFAAGKIIEGNELSIEAHYDEGNDLPYMTLPGVWIGDSGTAILSTYNGETYIVAGYACSGNFSRPVIWDWLDPLLQADGVYKTLINRIPQPTIYKCDPATGNCLADPSGTHTNWGDCSDECDISVDYLKFTCKFGICEQSPNGVGWNECQATCGADPPLPDPTSALDYEVWASSWSYNPSYDFVSIVPMVWLTGSFNNAFRTPGPMDQSDYRYNQLKSNLLSLPESRRTILLWYFLDDLSPFRQNKIDWYRNNTSDGSLYDGKNFLTIWQDSIFNHCKSYMDSILIRLEEDNVKVSGLINDTENWWAVYSLSGYNAYYSGITGPDPEGGPYGIPLQRYNNISTNDFPDARMFSALINDPRFNTQINPIVSKTFSEVFLDNYKKLTNQPNLTSTSEQILNRWRNITYQGDFRFPNTADEIFNISPAWDAALRMYCNTGYTTRMFESSLNDFTLFQAYVNTNYSNYDEFPISLEESNFARNSNNIREYNPLRDFYSNRKTGGGRRYYGNHGNIIYAWYLDPTANLQTTWNGNSGYVNNPITDEEKYNWVGYIEQSYSGPAGDINFQRYAETSNNFSNTIWKNEIAHKEFVNDVKYMRLQLRSYHSWWKTQAPWIQSGTGSHSYGYSTIGNRYHTEMIYHLILHGFSNINIFGSNDVNIHQILTYWRTISNNSKVHPCSNVTGELVNAAVLVDRVLIHDAVENILISGGKSIRTGKYIWRLTAPPSKLDSNNFVYFRKLPTETDTSLPDTISVDCSNSTALYTGIGTWIIKDTPGMPKYETYIPETINKYSCNAVTHSCYKDSAGTWTNEADCNSKCAVVPPPNKFDCVSGSCTQTRPDGEFDSYGSCVSSLTCKTYDCISADCVPVYFGPAGEFLSYDECAQSGCIPPPPPTPNWGCVNSKCVYMADGSGTYVDKPTCEGAGCVITWDCIGFNCTSVYGPGGWKATVTDCLASCFSPPPPPNDWECINSVCIYLGDGSGSYETEQNCEDAGCVITWDCIGSECILVMGPNGNHTTEQLCLDTGCESVTTWNCESYNCTPIDNDSGQYETEQECEDSGCVITWNCGGYNCNPVGGPSGVHKTEQLCLESGCETITWSCISNVCTLIPNTSGQYETEQECINSQCEDPEGACCLSPENCEIRRRSQCPPGNKFSSETSCTPTFCPAIGRCCSGGTCTDTGSSSDCSGIFIPYAKCPCPNPFGWRCNQISHECDYVPGGEYELESLCNNTCALPPTTSWNCVESVCHEIGGTSGEYDNEVDCISDCQDADIPPTWDCVNLVCVLVEDGSGAYSTHKNCINSGCFILPPDSPLPVPQIFKEESNPTFVDQTKLIPITPLNRYPYNSR